MKKLILPLLFPIFCQAQNQIANPFQLSTILHKNIYEGVVIRPMYEFTVRPDSFIYINFNGEYYKIKINSAYPISIEHNNNMSIMRMFLVL